MNASQRQEFCVRWNSHLGSIGAAFPQLLAGQRFVDVTLACEGHQVHCHRLVLAACSSYFESILAENPCKHPVIILPSEIKLWEIQALVDFMYKGEVNVTQAGLPQLLRCAEQLRIRGLYGSDAALNLNQLKALTNKATAAAVAAATAANMTGTHSTCSMGGGGISGVAAGNGTNDSTETDDTATNSTTTTTTAASALQQLQAGAVVGTTAQMPQEIMIKKELPMQQTNGDASSMLQQQHMQQIINYKQQQQKQQQQHQQQEAQALMATTSNVPTEDESADDSNSNAYDQYEEYAAAAAAANAAAAVAAVKKTGNTTVAMHLDSTIEDDHNYVAHDEDSFGPSTSIDTEHESTANSSLLQNSMDANSSFKRVRRSEASLAQAAKCVSKGQTFQTVSNMYNIPVSTIRFYMARKGILPKRKRGRGASSSGSGSVPMLSSVMSQAIAHMKHERRQQQQRASSADSPTSLESTPYQLVGGNSGSGVLATK